MGDDGFCLDDFIFDANASNFAQVVLNNSKKAPVLLHFRSAKIGGDSNQYTLLQKLVKAYRGTFVLVNMEADANHKIEQDLNITTIPTLKLFVDRKVVETLSGFLNEQDLRFLLDQHVTSEDDLLINDALDLFKLGQTEQAYQMLGQAALKSPHYYKLPLTMASLLRSQRRYEEALNLLSALPQPIREKPGSQHLMLSIEFEFIAAPVQDASALKVFVQENAQELSAMVILAAWHVTRQEYAEALELFLKVMKTDRYFEDDLGRKSILKILQLLPDQDPLIEQYRSYIHHY